MDKIDIFSHFLFYFLKSKTEISFPYVFRPLIQYFVEAHMTAITASSLR